jgi:hypothetical protein
MLDFIETTASPFVGATFSPEAIYRCRVVASDESDVDGRGGPEGARLQAALERWPDQPFEITVEQLHQEGLVE